MNYFILFTSLLLSSARPGSSGVRHEDSDYSDMPWTLCLDNGQMIKKLNSYPETNDAISLADFEKDIFLRIQLLRDDKDGKGVFFDSVFVMRFQLVILFSDNSFYSSQVSGNRVSYIDRSKIKHACKIIIQDIRAKFGTHQRSLSPVIIKIPYGKLDENGQSN